MVSLHCWIVLGDQGVRKGSLIRALSGRGQQGHFDVMLANGQNLRFWTAIMSANEGNNPEPPDQWVAGCTPPPAAGRPNLVAARQNILAAFRFSIGRPGYEAEEYLNELARTGATIESIVTLGQATPDWVKAYGAPTGHVVDVSVATNRIAEQVRTFWEWR